MASSPGRPPLRISRVAGRYLIFNIDDVMYLRRNHNMCSVFVGTTPQNPSQNIFMGLPLELMPEEARVLVDKNVAIVVDDAAFHPARLASLDDSSRRAYLQSLKSEGRKLQLEAIEEQQRSKPKHAKARRSRVADSMSETSMSGKHSRDKSTIEDDVSLFDSSPPPQTRTDTPSTQPEAEVPGYAVTPTTSSLLLTPPPSESDMSSPPPPSDIDVPASYPLYAHLQDKGYYMMPGLRFGCDYNVYPGDPLRFHSHFQATSYGWKEEIAILDLTAGGRLGTNVKKGFLIGGSITEPDADAKQPEDTSRGAEDDAIVENGDCKKNNVVPSVRTFCIEWAGM